MNIRVGDLVWVVRGCCDAVISHYRPLGIPWKVVSIFNDHSRCEFCKREFHGAFATPGITFGNGADSCPVSFLQRIDPLTEPEEHKEEATA